VGKLDSTCSTPRLSFTTDECPQVRLHKNGAKLMFSVKLAYILLLGVVCCSASRAHEFSNMPRDVMKSLASATVENKTAESASEKADQGRVLSRLTPTQKDDEERHGIQSLEPIGMIGDISAKWADLQSRFRLDEEILSECRAGSTNCPRAARRFLQIVELGRQRQGRARLAEVNRAVNFSIKPLSDLAQHGVDEFWSAPLETLSAEAGDCEDYALLKYFALHEAGIALDDMRILLGYHFRRMTNHAVLAVHLDQEWLILDNLTLTMVNRSAARHYRALFAVGHRGVDALGLGGAGDDLQMRPAGHDLSRTTNGPDHPRL
jgi:predicted transglutaminase-like cysteine proteinase